MNRSQIVAIITGAISLILAIAYLVLVQILDFRGEMIPAPVSQIETSVTATHQVISDKSKTFSHKWGSI